MYEIALDKKVIKYHLSYDKWKYVLGVVIVIFFWSLLTTVTAPKTPSDKKVDFYFVGGYMPVEESDQLSETMLKDFPNLMEINISNIPLDNEEMEVYSRQKLVVMIGAQEGDIYAFEKDEFASWAKMGAFLPLDDYDEIIDHFTEEELAEYTYTTEDDLTPRIYGVPIKDLGVFDGSLYDTSNSVMGIMAYSKNVEGSIDALEWLLKSKQ